MRCKKILFIAGKKLILKAIDKNYNCFTKDVIIHR